MRRARGSAIHAQLFILEELILEMLGDGFRHGLSTMGAGVVFLDLIGSDHSTIVTLTSWTDTFVETPIPAHYAKAQRATLLRPDSLCSISYHHHLT